VDLKYHAGVLECIQPTVAVSSNEPSGYTKGRIFLDHLRDYWLQKKYFAPWSLLLEHKIRNYNWKGVT
jgi:hypothetical protein